MSDWKERDLKQSHSAKSKNIQEPYSSGTGLMSQSTEILNNSQESNSEQMELFPMSSAGDIPANRSASQVVKEAKKTKDISGLKCIDLYESVGLDGSFPRMLVDTLNSVSTRYSLHWRLKDTPSGRLLLARALSMPRTKETGSGLWLTPTAVQTDEHPDKMKKRMEKYPNGTTVGSLTSQVKYSPLWPTPTAMTGGTGVAPSHKNGKHGWNIGAAVNDSLSDNPTRMWATPNTMDHLPPRSEESLKKLATGHRKGRSRPSNLREQVDDKTMALWPTPRANKVHPTITDKNREQLASRNKGNLEEVIAGHTKASGQLNPTWVEWLMGFPLGHTELKDWETRSSRKSPK